MNLSAAKAQASNLFPEFNFPEVITPEGLVKIYSDSAVCLKEGEFFKVYINDIMYGESELSPVAAWHDACLNLPEQFLDFFNPEFSETGNYYTKEDISRDYQNQDHCDTNQEHGNPACGSPRQSSEAGMGTWDRIFVLRA